VGSYLKQTKVVYLAIFLHLFAYNEVSAAFHQMANKALLHISIREIGSALYRCKG